MFDVYAREGFMMVLICSALPLLCSSIIGLLVAILQTATQIQEQTISYLAKFLTVSLVFYLGAEFFSAQILRLITELLNSMALLGKIGS